jgi:tRNA (mo5U34)-methyltransferase
MQLKRLLRPIFLPLLRRLEGLRADISGIGAGLESRLDKIDERLATLESHLVEIEGEGGPAGSVEPAEQPGESPEPSRLIVMEEVPELHVRPPRLDHAVEMWRGSFLAPARPGAEALRWPWYHTIELPDGTVTPGIWDHRPLVPHYGLPDSLQGKRALDVGTADGFWAFEMERRGASVVALDLPRLSEWDLPPQVKQAIIAEGLDVEPGSNFQYAARALGSKVERVVSSVYRLKPSELGTFDFVHAGDILVHLESPIAALRSLRGVTDGTALFVDAIDPGLQGETLTRYLGGWEHSTWWFPSIDTLAQMILDAGFSSVRAHSIYNLTETSGRPGAWRAALLASTK